MDYIVICLTVLGIYGWHLDGQFLAWDDDQFIVNNPNVAHLSIENIKWAFAGIRFDAYQPLQFISYMVDGSLWPSDAFGYKLHSVILFMLAAVLLFFLLRRHGFSPFASLLGTLMFVAAPSRVESVIWVSARKDVLTLALALFAWHFHLLQPKSRAGRSIIWAIEYLLFICALLAKSSALVLPFLLLVMDVLWYRISWQKALLRNGFPILISFGVAVFLPRLWQESQLINILVPDGVFMRTGLVFWSVYRFCYSILWPFSLSPLYAAPDEQTLRIAFGVGMAVTVIFMAGLIGLHRHRWLNIKWVALLLMFFIGLAPFLNIVPMYYLVADRYLLFPSLAIALAVPLLLEAKSPSKSPSAEIQWPMRNQWTRIGLAVVVVAGIAINGVSASLYAARWQDSETFFATAVARQPHSFWAQMKYGETLRINRNFTLAEQAYRAARSIRPLSPSALGGVFWTTFEQDCITQHRDCHDAMDVTAHMVTQGSNVRKLITLRRKLSRAGFSKSAGVIGERLQQMGYPGLR